MPGPSSESDDMLPGKTVLVGSDGAGPAAARLPICEASALDKLPTEEKKSLMAYALLLNQTINNTRAYQNSVLTLCVYVCATEANKCNFRTKSK